MSFNINETTSKIIAAASMDQATTTAREVGNYVAQAHKSVRVLGFVGSLAVFVVSILKMSNVFGALIAPLSYMLNVYLVLFSLLLMIIESNNSWIGVNWVQKHVRTYCRCLTTHTGRGTFQIFIGTFILASCGSSVSIIALVCSAYFFLLGSATLLVLLIKPDLLEADQRGMRSEEDMKLPQ